MGSGEFGDSLLIYGGEAVKRRFQMIVVILVAGTRVGDFKSNRSVYGS